MKRYTFVSTELAIENVAAECHLPGNEGTRDATGSGVWPLRFMPQALVAGRGYTPAQTHHPEFSPEARVWAQGTNLKAYVYIYIYIDVLCFGV